MSTPEHAAPADFEQYRLRRAQREPLSPETVKAILTGQPDSADVSVSYGGEDATLIRKHAELLGITPQDFITRAMIFAVSAQQLHEQGFEWPILRFVPPHLRFIQTAIDNTVRFSGGYVKSMSPVDPEV